MHGRGVVMEISRIVYEFVLPAILSSRLRARIVSKPRELLSLNRKAEIQDGESPGTLSFRNRTSALTTGRFIFMRGTSSFSQ